MRFEAFRAYDTTFPPTLTLTSKTSWALSYHRDQGGDMITKMKYHRLTGHYPVLLLPGSDSNTHLVLGGPGTHCCLEPSSLPSRERDHKQASALETL